MIFLSTFLYRYFYRLQENVEKVDIFINLFGKLLGARGYILWKFQRNRVGGIPSSLSEKTQERSHENSLSKISLTQQQGWGLLGFSSSLFLLEIKEKKESLLYLYVVFVCVLIVCFLYVYLLLCLVFSGSIVYGL